MIFYKFGYRLTNQFEPVKVGSIELSSNENDLQIFLNNREQRATPIDGRYILEKITSGLHSVVVSKEGFWPWTKTVSVAENNTRFLYAFIFPKSGIITEKISQNIAVVSHIIN